MAAIVIDTDVASRLQRRTLPGEVATSLVNTTITLSFVTAGELLKWAEMRSWRQSGRG